MMVHYRGSMHDLVIRRGNVIDGSGGPARNADIAIDGDRVVEVGSDVGAGTREIDADGLLVTPGFVDVHTHYDAQATWDPYLTPSSWHGVTTAVMGNCGVGFAPAQPDKHEWLIEVMEGVEDIPGTALTEGIQWEWESFTEYLDALDRRHYVLDLGAQVPHSAVRGYVMGDRSGVNNPATADDLERMASIVADGLRAGALGFSTSRTPLHKSKSGELVPGTMVESDELFAIAAAMQDVGHGVFQFAPEHAILPEREWPWMRELASRFGRTVSVNFSQFDQAPDLWREVLDKLDEAIADGIPIVAQVHGRTVGLLMCLEGSYHPLMFHPAYGEIADLPLAERCAALRSGPVRDRLIAETPDDDGFFEKVVLGTMWKTWAVADGDIDYEPHPDDSIGSVAGRTGVSPIELVIDHLLSADGHGMLYSPFFNYSYGDLSFNYEAHMHPGTRMGLADAGAHVRVICDGGCPTFMLTHWTRDRTRGPKMPLEYVVHRQTRQTAELYGLGDRGLLAPGMRADINVIDYDALTFGKPRMAWDLPGGAPRLVQKASGYRHTFCAGVETVTDDEFTGELPGRLVRGPR
ncbi:N-acyl-D-aspartate/D-glutamate deacylase [Ilumatobacter fluminis]|uniref:N-acyl-D-aspartate/D-glutamate deacylase n=2 Tax=Ilumatobacter fluminis TaxID=467091 RepID=A0A4R7HYZ7_9ACTN|nr:N-acyl-D-aspartate/D-glutamate deacylase [Ilumatobacter fluminis]